MMKTSNKSLPQPSFTQAKLTVTVLLQPSERDDDKNILMTYIKYLIQSTNIFGSKISQENYNGLP